MATGSRLMCVIQQHGWLFYRLDYGTWVDVLRLFIIGVGAVITIMVSLFLLRDWRRLFQARAAFVLLFGAVGIYSALQEVAELHHGMLWWRLPLLLIIEACAVIVLFIGPRTHEQPLRGALLRPQVVDGAVDK